MKKAAVTSGRPEELAKALPDKAELDFARQVFGTRQGVNFEGKYHILTLPRTLPDLAKDMKLSDEAVSGSLCRRQKEAAGAAATARQAVPQRDRPDRLERRDDRRVRGGGTGACRSRSYIAVAGKAADFVLKQQKTKDGRLLRTYGAAPGQAPKAAVDGYLEDYAFLVHGLLNLHDATGDKKWLDAGKELTDTMIEFHGDKKQGGFFFTAHDHEKLFARGKPLIDGAQPSGNSVAARTWSGSGKRPATNATPRKPTSAIAPSRPR